MIKLPLDFLWIPLLGLLPIIAGLIEAKKEKKFTLRAWVELVIGGLIILLSVNDSCNDNKSLTTISYQNDTLRFKIDTLLDQKHVDSTDIASLTQLIKDSCSNGEKTIERHYSATPNPESPIFMIADEKYGGRRGIELKKPTKDDYDFEFRVYSKDETSSDYDIKLYIFISDSSVSDFQYAGSAEFLDGDFVLAKNMDIVKKIGITTTEKFYTAFFIFKGSYKNLEKTKTFKVDYLMGYEINTGMQGMYPKYIKDKLLTKLPK